MLRTSYHKMPFKCCFKSWFTHPGEYVELTGEQIPFKRFGFSNLEAFIHSLPDVVSVSRYKLLDS